MTFPSRILIAGASGFVGRALLAELEKDPRVLEIRALSRNPNRRSSSRKTSWRMADLSDYASLAPNLKDIDLAIYLVHSMAPQAHLAQGTFEDFDLLQADHFSQACEKNKVKDIFYLGGMLEDQMQNTSLSAHLRSRLEVERVLASRGARVTALRAGLVLGSGGSSAEMLIKLVQRLPFMLVPRWAMTESEPIDLQDVIRSIHQLLPRSELWGRIWDLPGPRRITYAELMTLTANSLGLKRTIISLPWISPSISQLWVSTISGAPRALVYPLIRSLSHPMRSDPHRSLPQALHSIPRPLEESLREMVRTEEKSRRRVFSRFRGWLRHFSEKKTVRSVQRLRMTPSLNGSTLSQLYFEWLSNFFGGILRIERAGSLEHPQYSIRISRLPWILLQFESIESDSNWVAQYAIRGGLLQKRGTQGTLEFRTLIAEQAGLCIVQDFVPRLPWMLYRMTQAPLHLWVMNRFRDWLEKRGRQDTR